MLDSTSVESTKEKPRFNTISLSSKSSLKTEPRQVDIYATKHGDKIHYGHWTHQLAVMFCNEKGARSLWNGFKIKEDFNRFKIGEIVVIRTTDESPFGLVRDSHTRFRMIKDGKPIEKIS